MDGRRERDNQTYRLINNQIMMTEIDNMIIFENNRENEIMIEIDGYFDFRFLLIWNFNEDLSIGIRECQVFFNEREIFDGILS